MSTALVRKALAPRRGRRSWTVSYGDVSSLFNQGCADLRAAMDIPEPTEAIVYRNKGGVTVTAHASSETITVKWSVMIPFKGACR